MHWLRFYIYHNHYFFFILFLFFLYLLFLFSLSIFFFFFVFAFVHLLDQSCLIICFYSLLYHCSPPYHNPTQLVSCYFCLLTSTNAFSVFHAGPYCCFNEFWSQYVVHFSSKVEQNTQHIECSNTPPISLYLLCPHTS